MINTGRSYFYSGVSIFLGFLLLWSITQHWFFGLASLIIFMITIMILFLFRDPDRLVPDLLYAIVSPADGKIVSIERNQSVPFYSQKMQKISIYLSLFDVHINRIPFNGRVTIREYKSGEYHPAYKPTASEKNEQLLIGLKTQYGMIFIKQIGGFLARRIVCNIQPGDEVARGERYGMIKFGSRVELYVPLNFLLKVEVGNHVRAGSYIIGEFVYGQ